MKPGASSVSDAGAGYPGVDGRVHLNGVHPLTVYGPADEHTSAFGVPAYPAAHSLLV